jgi:hypothetical protein
VDVGREDVATPEGKPVPPSSRVGSEIARDGVKERRRCERPLSLRTRQLPRLEGLQEEESCIISVSYLLQAVTQMQALAQLQTAVQLKTLHQLLAVMIRLQAVRQLQTVISPQRQPVTHMHALSLPAVMQLQFCV